MPVFPFVALEHASNATRAASNVTVSRRMTMSRRAPPQASTSGSSSNSTRQPLQPRQAPSLRRMGSAQPGESTSSASTVVPLVLSDGRVSDESDLQRQQRGSESVRMSTVGLRRQSEAHSLERSPQLRPILPSADAVAAAAGGTESGVGSVALGPERSQHSTELQEAREQRRFMILHRRARREHGQDSSSIGSLPTTIRGTETGLTSNVQWGGRYHRRQHHYRSSSISLTRHSDLVLQSLTTTDSAEVRHGRRDRGPDSPPLVLMQTRERTGSVPSSSARSGRSPVMALADAPSSPTVLNAARSVVRACAAEGSGTAVSATQPGDVEGPHADITILISSQEVQLTTSQNALRHQARCSTLRMPMLNVRCANLHSDQALGTGTAAAVVSQASARTSISTQRGERTGALQSKQEDPLEATQGSCCTAPYQWQLPVLTTMCDGDVTQPTRCHYPPSPLSTSAFPQLQQTPKGGVNGLQADSENRSTTANLQARQERTSQAQQQPLKAGEHTDMAYSSSTHSLTSSGTNAPAPGKNDDAMSHHSNLGSTNSTLHDESPNDGQQAPRKDTAGATPSRVLSQAQMASYHQMQPSPFSGELLENTTHTVPSDCSATGEPMPLRSELPLPEPWPRVSGSRASLGASSEHHMSPLSLQRHDRNVNVFKSGDGRVSSNFSPVTVYSFSLPSDTYPPSPPTESQQRPPPPRPTSTAPVYPIFRPWVGLTYNDAASHHTTLEGDRHVGEEESAAIKNRRQSEQEKSADAFQPAPPHTGSIAKSVITAVARSNAAADTKKIPQPQPESRLRLPVARDGVTLLNHTHSAPPQGELYRLLRMYHGEELHQFPKALRGPPLSLRLAGHVEAVDETGNAGDWEYINGATSGASHGRRGLLRGYRTPMATPAAVDVPMMEINASHPHDLYSRLVNDPVDCAVVVVHPGAATAPAASSTLSLSLPCSTRQAGSRVGVHVDGFSAATVLGVPSVSCHSSGGNRSAREASPSRSDSHSSTTHSGRSAPVLSCSSAEVVANGFYNAEVRESRARRYESQHQEAVAEYGEASYYSLEVPMHGTTLMNDSQSPSTVHVLEAKKTASFSGILHKEEEYVEGPMQPP